jgi:hypothetical protein
MEEQFMVLFQYLSEETQENHKTTNQDKQSPGRDWNQIYPEFVSAYTR